MKKIYKRKSLRRLAAAICAALTAGTLGFSPVLYAHPILDSKDAAVSIETTGNVMDITSTAQDNLIKWVDFSISGGKTVDFHDKNYLNYVTGSAVSDIQGILKGTGNIYLVNPNGILIGDGATINVGNLYLSTKNLTDAQLADYTTATSALSAASIADGDVINLGKLNADTVVVEGNNITFKNVADVKNGGAINTNVTLTANSGGEIHIGSATGGESGYNTNGTTYNYKLVSTKEELQNMQNNLDGNYMLADNIDMNGAGDFTPIGSPGSFTGRFDGLNHKLSNLTIKLGDYSYGGLFRMNDGTIENLEISGVKFTDATGEWNPNAIGAVVGYNIQGTIKNVRNTGSMTLAIDRNVNNIGGIAGINDGTIENASNAANISYDKIVYYLGGISGYNKGTIKNVSNSGAITGVDSQNLQVGGIVGSNFSQGKIEKASNTGSITGGQNARDIAGSNAGTITDDTGAANTPSGGDSGNTGGNTGNTGGNSGGNTGSITPANPTTPTDTTPTTPSSDSGNTGSTTPTNPTTPTEPTPIAPSGNTDSTTPNSGGNTSGTGANTPAPLAAAEPVIVAAVTETETIAAAATAGVTAEMSHIADNVRPTNIAEQPTNGGGRDGGERPRLHPDGGRHPCHLQRNQLRPQGCHERRKHRPRLERPPAWKR